MVPWLIFGSGILAGVAIAGAQDDADRISPPAPDDAVPSPAEIHRVQKASTEFLPFASGVIAHTKAEQGGWFPSWREAVSFLPGLTEATALYYSMIDKNTPFWVKGIAAFALVYLISPLDFIPDEIPGFGQLDDLTVIYFAYRQVGGYVLPKHYSEATHWLVAQGIEPKPFFELGKILNMEAWATEYEAEHGKLPQLPGPTAP